MANFHSIDEYLDSLGQLQEFWKDINGYEGYYQVSTFGNVRSLNRWIQQIRKTGKVVDLFRTGRPMKANTIKGGYQHIMLRRNNIYSTILVHRVVLETFIGPCPDGMECRHFPDKNPKNNRLDNLIWGTPKRNVADQDIHGTKPRGSQKPQSKLKEEDIPIIRRMLKESNCRWGIMTEIGNMFGVPASAISCINRGETWTHVPKDD